jgi:hypothetical protein
MFSARGAGILGFSMFGRDKIYALDENMQLDVEGLKAFLEKHEGEDIFLFGFTFMIWQHFCAELRKSGYKPDLSRGVLIHGGGWKKLADQHITTAQFKQELFETCGLTETDLTKAGITWTELAQIGAAYRQMEEAKQQAALTEKENRIAELEKQLAAEKKNKENRAASPGSQKDTGGQRQKTDFDDFMSAFG